MCSCHSKLLLLPVFFQNKLGRKKKLTGQQTYKKQVYSKLQYKILEWTHNEKNWRLTFYEKIFITFKIKKNAGCYLFILRLFIYIQESRGVLTFFQQTQSVQYKTSCQSVDPLDELLLHHAVEGDVGQVWDEGVAHTPADARAAPEVEQGQVGETL